MSTAPAGSVLPRSNGSPRISIIGAGIAGLSLACRLQGLNIPFGIYEARSADSIGHNYAITLIRSRWKPLVKSIDTSLDHQVFRDETAVDRILGGRGLKSHQTPKNTATFQAVDRDARQWLVQKLSEKGVDIKWNHKLIGISTARDGRSAQLTFEDQQPVNADLIIDTGGLRSPAFDLDQESPPEPKLLPYATYYGTRKITSEIFQDKFAHYFKDGNIIELVPENPDTPYISIQKVHLGGAKDSSTVELRWVYSRPPREGDDPLWRPNRRPQDAKTVPDALYDEIAQSVQQTFSESKKPMLKSFFPHSELRNDRILNWHLRLRLPRLEYFTSNTKRGPYSVVAIGDAAHGLPIVRSQGANAAIADAVDLARWLEGANIEGAHPFGDRNFYKPLSVYYRWFRSACEAVQDLRKAHGQSELTNEEMKDTIGFWEELEKPSRKDSSSESESDIRQHLRKDVKIKL